MSRKLNDFFPLGTDYKREIKTGAAALSLSAIFSLIYFISLENSYNELFFYDGQEKVLREGAVMDSFADVLGISLAGFALTAVCAVLLCVWHYASHWYGSKSIYVMRRLPERRELHIRCLAAPVLTVLACALLAFIILAVYYGIYIAVAPEGTLLPGQWRNIWNVWLGV